MGFFSGHIVITGVNNNYNYSGRLETNKDLRTFWAGSTSEWTSLRPLIIYPFIQTQTGVNFVGNQIELVRWTINGKPLSGNVAHTAIENMNGYGEVPVLKVPSADIFGSGKSVIVKGEFRIRVGNGWVTWSDDIDLYKGEIGEHSSSEVYHTYIEVRSNGDANEINDSTDLLSCVPHVYKQGNDITSECKFQWFISSIDDLTSNSDGDSDGFSALKQSGSTFITDNDSTADYYASTTPCVIDGSLIGGSAVVKVKVFKKSNGEYIDEDTVTVYDLTDPYMVVLTADKSSIGQGETSTITAMLAKPNSLSGYINNINVTKWEAIVYKAPLNNGEASPTNAIRSSFSLNDQRPESTTGVATWVNNTGSSGNPATIKVEYEAFTPNAKLVGRRDLEKSIFVDNVVVLARAII